MKVKSADMSNPLVRKIYNLKLENQTALLSGRYRDSIKARKELAKIATDHFDTVSGVENPVRGNFSTFGEYRRRILFAALIDKFRIKTPEEKKFITKNTLFAKGLYKNTIEEDANPLVKQIFNLKSENQISALSGIYKDSIKARQELAEIGVKHFELVRNVKNPVQGQFGILSKYGRRLLTSLLIDKFRIKTPAEKEYIKMYNSFKKGL